MAPDGEIISVGGSVARGGQGAVYDVGNINDVLMPHRHEGRDLAGNTMLFHFRQPPYSVCCSVLDLCRV